MPHITRNTFVKIVLPKLPNSSLRRRALRLFKLYTRQLESSWGYEVMTALLDSSHAERSAKVIALLEAHYSIYKLEYEHTRRVFNEIREKLLGLPTMQLSLEMHPLKPSADKAS